jgi:hypothetical protein
MQVKVLLSSGDEDTWDGVADAFDDAGSLIVVSRIENEDVPLEGKFVRSAREVDQGPDLPPRTEVDVMQVNAIYAPGMWMKVEYVSA